MDMLNSSCFSGREDQRPFSEIELFGTLGPSCHERDTLVSMIQAGMNGIRLNLSHGSLKQCEEWIEALHEAEELCGCRLNFLMDLKGRELRIGRMDELELSEGQIVSFGHEIPAEQEILQLIRQGDLIDLDDGQISLRALSYDAGQPAWLCEVLAGGLLGSLKSVRIRGRISPFSPLCEQDLENLACAARYGVSSVMVPFVQCRQDLERVRCALDEYGLSLKIYAKIENRTGMKNLKDFAGLADVIVIARGDLGTDTGLYELPGAQADIEKFCRRHDKDYMVVTQMLTSMIDHPICTRAEANDVFSAIRNGACSVMVTNETAAGNYPVQTIKTLYRLARSGYAYRLKEIAETQISPDRISG